MRISVTNSSFQSHCWYLCNNWWQTLLGFRSSRNRKYFLILVPNSSQRKLPSLGCMIGIFIYWIYNLYTEANQPTVMIKFSKITNGLVGSLRFNRLGHEDYFTNQGQSYVHNFLLVLLCIVNIVLPSSNKSKRISNDFMGRSASLLLWECSFTYLMGYIFLTKIYKYTL